MSRGSPIGYVLLAAGVIVALVGLFRPISGTPTGSTTTVSCGIAASALTGAREGDDRRIMAGTDTAVTKSAWCDGEAGDWLRPTLAASGALVVSGAAIWVVSSGRRHRHCP